MSAFSEPVAKGYCVEFEKAPLLFYQVADDSDAELDKAIREAGLWQPGKEYPWFTTYRDGQETGGGGGTNSGVMGNMCTGGCGLTVAECINPHHCSEVEDSYSAFTHKDDSFGERVRVANNLIGEAAFNANRIPLDGFSQAVIVVKLLRYLGTANNNVYYATPVMFAEMCLSVGWMHANGCEFTDDEIDNIVDGDQDEVMSVFVKFGGFQALHTALNAIFEHPAPPPPTALLEDGLSRIQSLWLDELVNVHRVHNTGEHQWAFFSKTDWYGFAGAEKFVGGQEPIIFYFKVMARNGKEYHAHIIGSGNGMQWGKIDDNGWSAAYTRKYLTDVPEQYLLEAIDIVETVEAVIACNYTQTSMPEKVFEFLGFTECNIEPQFDKD